ncbi:rod shape-determining protein MreD [Blochmannia endosymbiont of Camponotus (Colobopsis) obliquus]|uniref:rod shape-determining protein MreD n=1 Tax=Blochmannia endosymbiont of Camponotus (Colobopsis) obliquus TaxID=1505597 RepID=UPI00061A8AFD|nr:rod shape-determining protein MreD [Blochmannia endosymbiont of Camponotus (Colobopsis) obliquus]AKC60456.1 rod shape-determining protein MreD [Blochmannia endosymbiont of Camponotus (Colobopsis) obliquus]
MYHTKHKNTLFIYYSFFISLIFQTIPWPLQLYSLKPSWMKLILIYWITIDHKKINIGTSFLLGLITDLILGSTLGIHSLVFSMLAYFIVFYLQPLHNLIIYKQIFIIMLLSLITKTIIIIIDMLINNILFRPEIFLGSVIDGLLWPWFSLLMNNLKKLL